MVVEKDDLRAFAFLGDALRDEIIDDSLEAVVVKTFAQRLVKLDAEPAVNLIELVPREIDHFVPNGEVFGVAILQLHQFLTGASEHGFVSVAGGVDELV